GQKLDDYDGKWLLKDKVGELTLRSGLIFGFIVIFGLLVGPLNLFWLAGAKRRHRLFWTTPALSLAGSALLVALMILQDGTGGSGARMVLVTLLPEQKKLAVTQEQVARTGVLIGGTFPVAEAGWMLPLDLDNEQRGGYNSSDRGRASFFDDGQNRWGDWFSSRSVQGHLLRSVRPSRASVELFPDADPTAPPSVVSSVEVSLAKLFVVDDASRYWVAEDVGTGEKKVLRPATKNDYQAWLRSRVQDLAGPVIQHSINEMKARPGTIFAEAADPSRLAVPTLNAIRWNDNVALIAGRYVKRS
ncbi:MAG TPA: hypothetical protein VK956_08760, partial [Verrucomicrobium sp.]|nr:hypothetical protein [Verrucomicrobium sp.]